MLALNRNESARKVRRLAAATAVLALACIALPSFAYAEVDVTPPVLAALTLPVQVSTGASGAAVAVSARITDDLSGVAASDARTACAAGFTHAPSSISLRSPSHAVFGGYFGPSGGDTYESVVQLPPFAEAGTWTVDLVSLTDCAGNTRRLTKVDLAAAGLPSTFTLRGEGDGTPPRLRALALDPPSVANTSPAVITVTATITDDLSGVATHTHDTATTCGSQAGPVSTVTFRKPSGGSYVGGHFARVSGDVYETTLPIPRYAEAGTWTLAVTLADCAQNLILLEGADLDIPHVVSTFQVTGSTDTTPPFPRRLSITPTIVDVRAAGADVVLGATLDDDLSGVVTASGPTDCDAVESVAIVMSPSGTRVEGGFVQLAPRDYSATLSLPRAAEPGTWTVRLELRDCAGNVRRLGSSELASARAAELVPGARWVCLRRLHGAATRDRARAPKRRFGDGGQVQARRRAGPRHLRGELPTCAADRLRDASAARRRDAARPHPVGVQELTAGLYHYKWKSSPEWRDVCRRLILGFDDGSRYSADVLFK